MTRLQDVIGRGTVIPAAGTIGQLYFTTLGAGTLLRDNGSSWDSVEVAAISNPMTTAGDLILGDTSGVPIRLPKGSDSFILTMSPSTHLPVWAADVGSTPGMVRLDGTVLAADAGTIDFSAIAGTYTSLRVDISGRTDESAAVSAIGIRMNNDSGSNYDHNRGIVDSTGVSTGIARAAALALCGALPGASATANFIGQTTVEIVNYAGTIFYKSFVARDVFWVNSAADTGNDDGVRGGQWRNTAAITRLSFITNTGGQKFKAGTTAALYGLL